VWILKAVSKGRPLDELVKFLNIRRRTHESIVTAFSISFAKVGVMREKKAEGVESEVYIPTASDLKAGAIRKYLVILTRSTSVIQNGFLVFLLKATFYEQRVGELPDVDSGRRTHRLPSVILEVDSERKSYFCSMELLDVDSNRRTFDILCSAFGTPQKSTWHAAVAKFGKSEVIMWRKNEGDDEVYILHPLVLKTAMLSRLTVLTNKSPHRISTFGFRHSRTFQSSFFERSICSLAEPFDCRLPLLIKRLPYRFEIPLEIHIFRSSHHSEVR
jgi:hypothetical protein